MFHELMASPTLVAAFIMFMTTSVAYAVSVLTRRKARTDVSNLMLELEKLRLEGQLMEARRVQAVALEMEHVRLETAQTHKAIAENLLTANMTVNTKLDSLQEVANKTHEITNSAKAAQDLVVQELRIQKEALQLNLANAATAAAAAMQAQKDLHAAELALEQQKVAALQQQVAQLTPQVLPRVIEGEEGVPPAKRAE